MVFLHEVVCDDLSAIGMQAVDHGIDKAVSGEDSQRKGVNQYPADKVRYGNESGQKRGTSFFSKRFGQGAKWWVGFIGGTWLFHSLATDEAGNVIPEEAAKLGQPASHGCIRLSMENAKWFYDTVPDGAKVHIQKERFKAS